MIVSLNASAYQHGTPEHPPLDLDWFLITAWFSKVLG